MTRPESHDIDEAAKRLFQSSIPPNWLIREQHPDYRIDYTVELFQHNESTGVFFHVQLKGTKAPKYVDSGRHISFRLQSDHLSYYLDKVRLPVFLVLVDVTERKAWWQFLQHYALDELSSDKWRQQKTLAVRIPVANLLSDTGAARAAIVEADKVIRDLHPGSPQAAVKAEQARFEAIDPRVNVRIRATADETAREMEPKEDFEVTVIAKGEEAVRKLRDSLESGKKAEFEPGELVVTGSPLFEQRDSEPYGLQFEKRLPAVARLTATLRESAESASLEFTGDLVGGTKRGEFDLSLPEFPFSLRIRMDTERRTNRMSLRSEVDRWIGQDVRWLAYIEPISAFYRMISDERFAGEDGVLELHLFLRGNQFVSGDVSKELAAQLLAFAPIVSALEKAMHVARELQLEVQVPRDFGPVHSAQIDEVYALLTEGVYCVPVPDAKVTLGMSAERVRNLLKTTQGKAQVGPYSWRGTFGRPFLGQMLDLGELQMELTEVSLESDPDELARQLDEDSTGIFEVALTGSPECEYTVRRLARS